MNFKVSSTILLNRLQSIGRVITNKPALQILDNFLFTVEGNVLHITASDLETTLVSDIELLETSGDVVLAVNAKLLMESLKEFHDQPLNFEVDESNLAVVVKTDNGNYNFIGANGDEFPKLPAIEDDASVFTIPAMSLDRGIALSVFATATDDLRPTMTGVYFDIAPEQITFVATDAHKLSRCINKQVKSGLEASFILPKKAAGLLRNVLAKETEDVEVCFDSKNIRFKLPTYTMVCRQIEGRFPNYSQVIPQNNPWHLTIDRVSLLNAVRRAYAFSNQGIGLVKLSIDATKTIVSSQDIDFSTSAKEEIACSYDGEALNIGFKGPFLIDILTNIDSPEIVMHLADATRAGVIKPAEDAEDEDLLMLLSPMMLAN